MSTDAAGDPQDAAQEWKNWHERRIETVSAPYGPLALTGTHWLADALEGRIPAVPGEWREDDDAVVLTAAAQDGITLDGEPFGGEVRLTADHTPAGESRLAQGARRLVVLRREGLWAVRVWDPEAGRRRAFAGIGATPYEARWAVPASFRPYDEARTVRVANADGVERGLGLGGELAFALDGREHTLQVAVEDDGALWAVFADATSGDSSFRFRFLRPGAPDARGRLTVDFNRALLPPCAFAEHFICPFPPPGNTLGAAVAAGERTVLTR
ncbi:DUF1684 domain-containing protein [Streptomyces sp. NPDC059994]|uniref:DUF1684 domain-containing protein n=1 Tax=Streptomyces sp. NPDC059994 TaxID=3347029 RepID=UPI003673B76E